MFSAGRYCGRVPIPTLPYASHPAFDSKVPFLVSTAAVILGVAVVGVTLLGFLAARWGGHNLADLDQWALGGRSFGTIVSWFLLGGDPAEQILVPAP